MTHLVAAEARWVAAGVVGMTLGVWLQGYRGWLAGWRPSRRAVFAGDLIFWAVALAVTALGLYWANWLDLRLYAAGAIAAGGICASLGAGWLVRGATFRAFRAARRLVTGSGRPREEPRR